MDGVQSEIGSVTDSGAAKEDGKSKKEEKVKLIQPKEESVIEPDIEINVEKGKLNFILAERMKNILLIFILNFRDKKRNFSVKR